MLQRDVIPHWIRYQAGDRSRHLKAHMQTPAVSIIVISYNTREMTIECLRSVFAETTLPFEIVVVDNASTDGSAEAISEAFPADVYPNLTLLKEIKNHGFAPAHSVALPHCKAPWLLLLNPDTVILDKAIDNLFAFAHREPEARIWGGRTLYGDKTLNSTSCWHRMTLWTIFCRTAGMTGLFPGSEVFNQEAYGDWPRDSERTVDIVTGCFLLIHRETWNALGGFDPTFVMYGEEADLCLRARAQGARPRITPDATIIHYGGASEPVAADRIVRVLRAKAELIRRHVPRAQIRLASFVFRLFPLTRRYATSLGGIVLGRPGLKQQSKIWAEVWNRRSEWQAGFQRDVER